MRDGAFAFPETETALLNLGPFSDLVTATRAALGLELAGWMVRIGLDEDTRRAELAAIDVDLDMAVRRAGDPILFASFDGRHVAIIISEDDDKLRAEENRAKAADASMFGTVVKDVALLVAGDGRFVVEGRHDA
jgi:hypothetical protein